MLPIYQKYFASGHRSNYVSIHEGDNSRDNGRMAW